MKKIFGRAAAGRAGRRVRRQRFGRRRRRAAQGRRLVDRLSVHHRGRRGISARQPGQQRDRRIDRHRRGHQAFLRRRRRAISRHGQRFAPDEGERICRLRQGRRQDVIEVPIGIDGLTLIEAKGQPRAQPDGHRHLRGARRQPVRQAQTAQTWKDVNPALPATKIRVLGPPPTSGTRDSLAELILDQGLRKRSGDEGAEEERRGQA